VWRVIETLIKNSLTEPFYRLNEKWSQTEMRDLIGELQTMNEHYTSDLPTRANIHLKEDAFFSKKINVSRAL